MIKKLLLILFICLSLVSGITLFISSMAAAFRVKAPPEYQVKRETSTPLLTNYSKPLKASIQ